jgi:hypothetical protein
VGDSGRGDTTHCTGLIAPEPDDEENGPLAAPLFSPGPRSWRWRHMMSSDRVDAIC